MSLPLFLLWLLNVPLFLHADYHEDDAGVADGAYLVNCGGDVVGIEDRTYVPDERFVRCGNVSAINDKPDLYPTLTSLRYFPDNSSARNCFRFTVKKGVKYLVRTTYYYGNFDGKAKPPVFEQFIDTTRWSMVDTAADYGKGVASFYEIMVAPRGRKLHVCLARNKDTGADRSPFINALEVETMYDIMYNGTNWQMHALATVARSDFGTNASLRYPDDVFNRLWHGYTDNNPVVTSETNITSSNFGNYPPERTFSNAITTSRGQKLTVLWPPVSLPKSVYYISLYFQDHRAPGPFIWRIFNVSINDKPFFSYLNVTTTGVAVYSPQWPLSEKTTITMTPVEEKAKVGPIISAAEVLQLVPLAPRTIARDVAPLEDIAESFENPPADWIADPCYPREFPWRGVTCKYRKKHAKVVALNLTHAGLKGTLSPAIANLSTLTDLWLSGNELSGVIPDLTFAKNLKTLHLDNNKLEGPIHPSLAHLPKICEIFLQNNNLNTSTLPPTLLEKKHVLVKV